MTLLTDLCRHATLDEFTHKVAAWVGNVLQQAIAEKGRATLVVSGGRTPVPVFKALTKYHLPWKQVTVLLADERWVAHNQDASNVRLVRESLLTGPAAIANFIPFPYGGEDIEADALMMDRQLAALSEPFDLVLLGMGDDGHTASLFPGAVALDAGLSGKPNANCIALKPTEAPHARLSMTLPRLLHSEQIGVLLQGESKLDIYQKALKSPEVKAMPIRGILLQDRVPVVVHWCP